MHLLTSTTTTITFALGLITAVLPLLTTAMQHAVPKWKTLTVPALPEPLFATTASEHLGSLPAHNNRLVYYTTRDGHAISDGDISLGLERDLLREVRALTRRRLDQRAPATPHLRRALSIFPDVEHYKWPNATLTYKFLDAATEAKLQPVFDAAIAMWRAGAPWMSFRQLPSADPDTPGAATILYTENEPACWATVGWCAGCSLHIKIDAACGAVTTAHEIGHALGFHHEQQRPDRDQHMDFVCENLSDYHLYGSETSACPGERRRCCASDTCWGWACAFSTRADQDHSGAMDQHSIMHYVASAFALPGTETLVGKNGYVVPQFDPASPSKGDFQRLCDIYHKECAAWKASGGGGGDDDGGEKPPVCGDGKVEGHEQCDDGNTVSGDGCSATCWLEDGDHKPDTDKPDTDKPDDECPPTPPPPPTGTDCASCSRNPALNRCHITTSCVGLGGSADDNYCACRAGYRASVTEEDAVGLVQWRIPTLAGDKAHRVFVRPGVICDTLCDDWAAGGKAGVLCGEVEAKTEEQC